MQIHFTKMQGAGNDFVMINAMQVPFLPTRAQLQKLADRRFGVGADQILVVEPPRTAGVDFRYRIYNADGGEVEQCGNGARCFVKFVHDLGLTSHRAIRVETLGGIIAPRLEDDGQVTVDMGCPVFEPARVPFATAHLVPQVLGRAAQWPLELPGTTVQIIVVSMGNPHAVQQVADVDHEPLATQGPLIEHHERFTQRVNAGYMQIVDRSGLKLRVWERGVGETLACGTGACAAVAAGIMAGLLDPVVTVIARGGVLRLAWSGKLDEPIFMTGPAETVYQGSINL